MITVVERMRRYTIPSQKCRVGNMIILSPPVRQQVFARTIHFIPSIWHVPTRRWRHLVPLIGQEQSKTKLRRRQDVDVPLQLISPLGQVGYCSIQDHTVSWSVFHKVPRRRLKLELQYSTRWFGSKQEHPFGGEVTFLARRSVYRFRKPRVQRSRKHPVYALEAPNSVVHV